MVALPVTLIGGYLGAGKTTLVNRLLRENGGRRLMVLVNDFGDINIDADLIEAQDDSIISLAGGCVCCSFGSDLVSTLTSVVEARANFDHLLIETSGVALPAAVARAVRLIPGLELEATLVLADALTVREQANDRYVGDMVRTQLAEADLILLNKMDLIAEPEASATTRWLAALVPKARIVPCSRAEGVAPLVFVDSTGAAPSTPDTRALQHQLAPTSVSAFLSGRLLRPAHAVSAQEHFTSLALYLEHAVDPRELANHLTDSRLRLLRAKGVVHDALGRHHLIQVVGQRAEVVPLARPTRVAGQLVVIGMKDHLNRADLLAAVGACRVDRDKIAP